MAQKSLFGNMKKRSNKKKDVQILGTRGERISVTATDNISGNKYTDAVMRAKSLSERILGEVLQDLELVTDEDRLDEFAGKAVKNGIMSLDSETGGLIAYQDKFAGICLYTEGEKGIYIPVGHLSNLTKMPLKDNISIDFIQDLFDWFINEWEIKIVYHNAIFEMRFFYWCLGIDLGIPYWDTMIASMLLNENESHSLKVLYNKYVKGQDDDAETAKFNNLFKGIKFYLVPPDVAYMYAGFDGIQTLDLYKFQKPFLTPGSKECKEADLEKVAKLFHKIEMPLIRVLYKMERRGIAINLTRMNNIKSYLENLMQKEQDDFYKLLEKYSHEFEQLEIDDYETFSILDRDRDGKIRPNINSSKQLAVILYDILDLKSNDRKKPRGTGADILEGMDHEIASKIKQYRSYQKLISTYTNYDEWTPEQTKRIHTMYKQNGAVTGRMSSENPSIMNIPSRGFGKIIRTIFCATDGYKLVSSDYSQQEPRIFAFICQETAMIQAYKEGKDLYAVIASYVFGESYEDCQEFYPDGSLNREGEKRRTSVKSILLGILYGRQTKSIAEQLGITVKEAERITAEFFRQFPKAAQYIIDVQESAREKGYVQTLGGRKRRLTDMQLEEYDVIPTNDVKASGFNAFDFDSEDDEIKVSDDDWYYYVEKYSKAWGYKQRQAIKEEANAEGLWIVDNTMKIADAERQCLNAICQGSAADMTKLAMILIDNDKELKDLGFRLLVPVHDELLGEAPEANAEKASERLTELMKQAASEFIDIPMKCDPDISDFWYQDKASELLEEIGA